MPWGAEKTGACRILVPLRYSKEKEVEEDDEKYI